MRRRAVRALPARAVLRVQGRPGVQPRPSSARPSRRRDSDVADRPPLRAAPAAGRCRQVRLVRRLPADRPRPRGRPARDRRAVRHRRIPGGDLAPLVRTVRRPARRGLDQHGGAARGAAPPPARDDDPRDHRGVRDRRRDPGHPQLVRASRRGRRPSIRSRSSSTSLAIATPDRRPRRRRRRAARLPDRSRPAARAADGARRRAAARSSPTNRSARSASAAGRPASSSPLGVAASDRSPGPAAAPCARSSGAAATAASGRAATPTSRAWSPTPPGFDDAASRAPGSPGSPPGRSRSARSSTATADHRAGRAAPEPVAAGPSDQGDRPMTAGTTRRRTRTQRFEVEGLTRVEGEGSLRLVVRDGEVDRGPPRDLRGAALLRATGPWPHARRGPRHRRPDLRHLPGRLPDERGPRLRGRRRHRARPGRPRPPSPAVLRRVDREPRPPRLLPPRPGLHGLPERHRAGPRPPRPRRAGPAPQEGGQPPRVAGRRPADPPGHGPGRRLLPRPDPVGDDRAPAGADRRRSTSPSRRSRSSRASTAGLRRASRGSSRSATRPTTR